MIVNREQGREHDRQQGKREGNMEKGRGGKGMHRFGTKGTYMSHTPQAASGRERGKGKAGRESGKGMEGREHSYTKHVISTELILNMWRDLCWVYALEINDLEINDLEIKRFRDQTTT